MINRTGMGIKIKNHAPRIKTKGVTRVMGMRIDSRLTITLGMIVKNEAENLRHAVKPWLDYVDEILIVDTGSTDDTVQIATALGAKVLREEWRDSFADARNTYIAHAQSDLILNIDADDRVDSKSVEMFKEFRRNYTDKSAYRFRVRNLEAGGKLSPIFQQIRMFPRTDSVRFVGSVHESVEHSLADNNYSLVDLPVTILHVGYADPALCRVKLERNLKLVQKDLISTINPTAATLYHYAQTMAALSPTAPEVNPEVVAAYRRVIEVGDTRTDAVFDAICRLNVLYIRGGDNTQALMLSQNLTELRPHDVRGWYYLGFAYAALNNRDEAIKAMHTGMLCKAYPSTVQFDHAKYAKACVDSFVELTQ